MKKHLKLFYNLLIYGSVAFAILYIFRNNDFTFSGIKNYSYFFLSVIVLVLSYVCLSFNWYSFLKCFDIKVPFRNAFISLGLTVFSKYIPGKVWLIVGRSSYLSQFAPDKTSILHLSSTYVQLLWTYTGSVVGAAFLLFVDLSQEWIWVISVGIAAMTILIFIPGFQRMCYGLLAKVMKKPINIPVLSASALLRLLPQFFLTWIIVMFGFDLLMMSMDADLFEWPVGMAFILALNISVFAIFLPGGIGFREGLLSGFLLLQGFAKAFALSVSVMSRIWFIVGEAGFFLIALIWNLKKSSKTELSSSANEPVKKTA
jgi:glycosyltransferase 2 family protein